MKLPIKFVPCGHFSSFHEDADGKRVDMDEINAALARAERMEKALREIAEMGDRASSWMTQLAGNKARAALADEEPTG